jgi:hypothetical protein
MGRSLTAWSLPTAFGVRGTTPVSTFRNLASLQAEAEMETERA